SGLLAQSGLAQHRVAVRRQIHVKLGVHFPRINLSVRYIPAVKSAAHQAIVPAAFSAQAGKLVLPHYHSSKPVGIPPGLAFLVADLVELAKGLAERLPDACREDPLAPLLDLRRMG